MTISVFELGYRYLMPSIRRSIAVELKERGLTQEEIAKRMRVSNSAVSRYLSMERGTYIDLSEFPDVREMIKELTVNILVNELRDYELQRKILEIALYALSRRYICAFHRSIDPNVDPERCNICPEIFK